MLCEQYFLNHLWKFPVIVIFSRRCCLFTSFSHTLLCWPATRFTLDSSIQSSDHVSPSACPQTFPPYQSVWLRLDTPPTWWVNGTWASAGPAASQQGVAFRVSWAHWLEVETTSPTRAAMGPKPVDLTCTMETGLPGRWSATTLRCFT